MEPDEILTRISLPAMKPTSAEHSSSWR